MSDATENGKASIHQSTYIDHETRVPVQTGGLTKREYMATQITAGLAVSHDLTTREIPAIAVQMADALLEELEK